MDGVGGIGYSLGMSLAHRVAFVALCTWVMACYAPIRVRSHPDPAPSMTGYRTYSWMSRSVPQNTSRQVGIASLDTRVRTAVDANLALKGYLLRSLTIPDFLIGYRAATKFKTTESFREFYDYRQSGGEMGPQESFGRGFEEASLTLEIIDAKTRQTVWRASAASVIGEKGSTERVNEAVRQMINLLPAAQ